MKCIKCDNCNVCSTIVSQFIPHNFCIVSYFQADTENCHKSMIFIDTLIYIDHNQANAELFGFLRIYLQQQSVQLHWLNVIVSQFVWQFTFFIRCSMTNSFLITILGAMLIKY